MRTTANWIAAVRARESSRPDRLFDDPYAEALAGPQGYAMMARSEQAAGGENRMVPVRVRWFDDAIIEAVASGIRTVVMLGAGLDTRPYRLPVFKDLHWYELDRRDVLEAKAAALAGIPPRATVTQLEADLTRELPLPVFEEPVVWVAEGLFFYFKESSIVDLLVNAARQCPQGSVFLGDVHGTAGLDSPAMRAYRQWCERTGNPPPYGCDDPSALFAKGGWRLVAASVPGAPDANFGRLPTVRPGLHPGAPHFVRARLPDDGDRAA
jgi:methyltransferase (TIGR00027 family)